MKRIQFLGIVKCKSVVVPKLSIRQTIGVLIGIAWAIGLHAQELKFDKFIPPPEPDYADVNSWAALPFHGDMADFTPFGETWIDDSLKKVDVFYIYPTVLLTGRRWNADIRTKSLNYKIDHYPLRFNASIFNHVGRVYAPRYRQANIKCYLDHKGNGEKALNLAYSDVKRAFEYYMAHHNQGRPIIIVSHSQGTTHARQLLKDYFDTAEMKAKLVCAYVVGFAIYPKDYDLLTPCADATETNCYVTWSSFMEKFPIHKSGMLYGKVCVNPISWRMDTLPATTQGGVLLNEKEQKRYTSTVYISGYQLMVKTNMPVVRYLPVMHVADFNLFYMDIRANAALRVEEYFRKQKTCPTNLSGQY